MKPWSMLMAAVILLPAGDTAFGASIGANRELRDTTTLDLVEADQDVIRCTNGTWSGYYDFGDKNGNGTRDDPVTPAGLNLQGFQISAIIDSSGNEDRRNIQFNLDGASITNGSGTSIRMYRTYNNAHSSDSYFRIYNVNEVDMGLIDVHQDNVGGSPGHEPAYVLIGQSGTRAGNIRVNGIWAHMNVAYASLDGSSVTIYGNGNVLIGTDPENLADISTWSYINGTTMPTRNNVLVDHSGSFAANRIDTRTRGTNNNNTDKNAGDITLVGGSASGDCIVNELDASYLNGHSTQSNRRAGDIGISGYKNVTIGSITNGRPNAVQSVHSSYTARPHEVTISAAQDITFTGAIDLNDNFGDGWDGRLKLTATGGRITLASLDASKFQGPSSGNIFTAKTGDGDDAGVYVQGELLGLDTTDNGTISQISAPANVMVWYHAHDRSKDPVTANQYLYDDDTWDGTKDGIWALSGGGQLRPYPVPPPSGTMIMLR